MNKIKVIVTLVFILAGIQSFSQKLTASFSLGYGTGLAKQDFSFNRTRTSTTDVRENVKYSLGSGLNLNGSIGYSFNENIETELGISYLMGGKTEATQKDLRDPASIVTSIYTISAKSLSFTPTLVFKTKEMGNLQPYAKTGLVIGIPTITSELNGSDTAGPDSWTEVWKYKGGTSLGFTSALGTTYKIGNFDLFGELFVISQSFAPKEGELIESRFNNTDILPSLTVQEKQIQFVDSYDRQANIPSTSPDVILKTYFPFSSFGLKAGIKFHF